MAVKDEQYRALQMLGVWNEQGLQEVVEACLVDPPGLCAVVDDAFDHVLRTPLRVQPQSFVDYVGREAGTAGADGEQDGCVGFPSIRLNPA